MKALIAAIEKMPNLTSLKYASAIIECARVCQLCAIGRCRAALRCGRVVASLVLPCCSGSLNKNDIKAEGAVALAKALPECKALVSLR